MTEIKSPLGTKITGYKIEYQDRVIPKLTGTKVGSNYELILDGRWGATIPEEHIHPVLMLVANALAIGAGYSSAEAETKDKPFAPISASMTW